MSNVTVAEKEPELELEDSIYSIPGVPFSSCSIGVATACETVSALAPGYDALIFTTGGVICGYWSIGSFVSPITPTITISIDSTIENTGRSMKKLTFMLVCVIVCYSSSVSEVTASLTLTFMPGVSLW